MLYRTFNLNCDILFFPKDAVRVSNKAKVMSYCLTMDNNLKTLACELSSRNIVENEFINYEYLFSVH